MAQAVVGVSNGNATNRNQAALPQNLPAGGKFDPSPVARGEGALEPSKIGSPFKRRSFRGSGQLSFPEGGANLAYEHRDGIGARDPDIARPGFS